MDFSHLYYDFSILCCFQTCTHDLIQEKLTVGMSKTAQKFSEMKIPKFMRKKFFGFYSKYYKVKLNQIVDPIDSFETFSAFFTRRVQPRPILKDPIKLLCPADSKVLKIS